MVATRPAETSSPSLIRRLAWPGAVTIALAALAACGGSSAGFDDGNGNPSAGAGGSASVAGTGGTQGGTTPGTSGSANGGKQTAGGGDTGEAMGGAPEMPGPEEGGADAGGAPGKPNEPPDPPGGMAGAGGLDPNCPLEPPTGMDECTDLLKCNYPGLECRCEGPEVDRSWKCKEPPKPMTMCPPMAPEEDAPCKTKDEEPAPPPCHYEEPAVDCTCAADKWACVEAP